MISFVPETDIQRILTIFKGSLSQMFLKISVLKNFAKFTEKHLHWSNFFNKVAGLRSSTLLKKKLQHRCFPANFAKFLKTLFDKTSPVAASWKCFLQISTTFQKSEIDDVMIIFVSICLFRNKMRRNLVERNYTTC